MNDPAFQDQYPEDIATIERAVDTLLIPILCDNMK